MNEPRKRHRWEETTGMPLMNGVRFWRCIHCGLHKRTEWEEKPEYTMVGDGRTWHRFAPPCPPGPTDTGRGK
jgi:hypothetical protein